MRRTLIVIILLFAAGLLQAQNYTQLDSLMNVYVVAMRSESPESKMAETDYMIGSAKDSLTRQHIALYLFDYYKQSPLMGEEEIAIHIYDFWIKSGKVAMRSEFDEMDAQLFADFNRSSLLGMQAPAIELYGVCGSKTAIPQKGKSALIWFYDVNCGKCKLEAELFPKVLEKNVILPINFYAVYTGQSKKEWRAFRRTFKVRDRKIKLVHLWDPEIESNYLKLYGVISTPKLYMVEGGGIIIGRRLELENLPEMFKLDNIISHSNSL